MKLLILIAIILLIIAVHQLMRVVELSRDLKKTKEWQVTENDNRFSGRLMLLFMVVFFGFFFWQIDRWADNALPAAASVHGENVDSLWKFNIYLISIVFLLTNFFLFFFAFRYYGRKSSKAEFYAHNNKLEMLWTVIPALVLAFIIIFGLKFWNEITRPATEKDRVLIELYAKQFDWTARFAGKDGKLGSTDYRQITGTNAVGMDTTDASGDDDLIVKNEFHLPVGKEIEFKMRSRDVIHSAYMPHFRAQMNCVPGMVTSFKFTPTKTTKQMREDDYVKQLMAGINKQRATEGKEAVEFDYILLCNKICGSSHFNMQMTIVVETEKEYNEWLAKQKAFKAPAAPAAPATATATSTAVVASNDLGK